MDFNNKEEPKQLESAEETKQPNEQKEADKQLIDENKNIQPNDFNLNLPVFENNEIPSAELENIEIPKVEFENDIISNKNHELINTNDLSTNKPKKDNNIHKEEPKEKIIPKDHPKDKKNEHNTVTKLEPITFSKPIPKNEPGITNTVKNKPNNISNPPKSTLFNFQQAPKTDSNITSMIFSKYYNKRLDTENEFRKLISFYESYSSEILFLYQNDNDKEHIGEEIQKLQNEFDIIVEKLLHTVNQQEKVNIISNFYVQNDLSHFQETIIKKLYIPSLQITKDFQHVDTKAYFQDFDPSLNKTEIHFDKVKFINPPKNYERKLDDHLIDEYDKFVATVNLIITFQKFIDFKTKFDQQNKLFSQEEKKLFEDEKRKDEERRIISEREKLQEEKNKIQKEEELLREEEQRMQELKEQSIDHKIKEKKKIYAQLKESITSLQNQIVVFEKKRADLEQHFMEVEKERMKVESELSTNYNDMLRCLKDTNKKQKKIGMLLHDSDIAVKHHSLQKATSSSEYSIESFAFIEMSKKEKEDYFNKLINTKGDERYDIKVKDFCILTEEINIATEQQFDYMINYYKYMYEKGDNDCKFIFKNLKIMPISMVERIYELKGFSAEYLSDEVLTKLVHRSLLVDKLIGTFEKILFTKEKNDEQERLIKKCKKDYYSICNSTSNEVFIYDNTKIIESLFFNGYNIEKVVIPESVIEIQDNAFYDCKNLKTVVLKSKRLKSIGKSAFSGCINLESFTIPEKIKVIHKSTFNGCQNLERIVLPHGLEEIKGKAFSGCRSLTKLKMPNTVSKIGKAVFEKCSSLQVFVIPGVIAIYPSNEEVPKEFNEVTSIQNFKISAKLFSKCSEIQNVIITKRCHLIDQFAFNLCSKLENINYHLSSTSKVGIYAFSNCGQLKHVVFNVNKNSALELSDSSFLNCKELSQVVFQHQELLAQNSVMIDSNVFSGCEKLKKFSFPPNSKMEIGECCFQGCKCLEEVTLPHGLTSIGKATFKGCLMLSKINLDSTINTIDLSAFENCEKLQLEHLPENVSKIGDNAFRNCLSLAIKEMPLKLEDIGENAFENCTKLVELVFPATMQIIRKKAFEGCTELAEITIYSKSIKILKKAFEKCSNLKKVFTDDKSEISSEAFKDCAKGLDVFTLESQ